MRLLLAEDERSLSKALVRILEHGNYSVDAVYDGQEALDYLDSGNYDGVILDIMMPVKDGWTVLRELRAAGNTIPVLMLTARSEVDDKVAGLDLGANDYLTKPFEPKELLARIRAMLRTGGSVNAAGPDLTMGNITLHLPDYTLRSPSGSYQLANKEFQIMEMLLRNRGQLITAERILEKIWGYDTESDINVVWVYLSYLRKKLTALGATVRIRAQRGVGYLLEETEE